MMQDDDATIQHWLTVLRHGTDAEKIEARRQLARVFEQRGMWEEAIDLLVANIRAGERDADTFRCLSRLYRAQGNEDLAMQAAAEAAKYIGSAQTRALVIDPLPRPSAGAAGPSPLEAEIQRYAA